MVRRLACVQSQEWAHAFWSLGQRTSGTTYADVRAEFDAGSFLRTHILRPTWHFVAAEDLGWITEVTAPRVHQLNGTIYRQYQLDQRRRDAATATIVEALAGGRYQTRAELGRLLGAEGVALAYLVMNAELEGVICSGPIRGAQHTYALVAERVADPARGDAGGAGPAVLRRARSGQRPGPGPLGLADHHPGGRGDRGRRPAAGQHDRGRRGALARRRRPPTSPWTGHRTGPCCCRCTTS